jgi:hypothetical protein
MEAAKLLKCSATFSGGAFYSISKLNPTLSALLTVLFYLYCLQLVFVLS